MTRLEEIKKRCEEATEGPWFDDRTTKAIKVSAESSAFSRGKFNIATYPTRTNQSLVSHQEWEGNAKFIAHSRQDIPWLVVEVERLQRENQVIKKMFCEETKERFEKMMQETIKVVGDKGDEG